MADYLIPTQLVVDEHLTPAANATVTVYDLNDTNNTTPLALKDLNGNPIPNPIQTTANALSPAVYSPVLEVKFVAPGTGLTLPVVSADGYKAAAEQAATDAAAAKSYVQGISVASVTQGDTAAATLDPDGKFSFVLPQGAPGKDGANVLPTDTAVAQAVNTGGSSTQGALDARYPKRGELTVNVMDYGAKGDGATDDSAAIQNAINAAPGGHVFFPARTYIANQLVSDAADTTLYAIGPATIKRSAAGDMLTIKGARSRVRGITFDGASLGGRGLAIRSTDTTVEDCTVRNTGSGLDAVYGWDQLCAGLTVRNCRIEGSLTADNSDNVTFSGNKVYAPSVVGAYSSVSIRSLSFTTSHAYGAKIVNNYIEVGANFFGINMISRNGAIPPSQYVIAGNTIVTTVTCNGGMTIDTCGPGTITGNTFRVAAGTPTTGAIEVVQCSGVVIIGNHLDGGGVMDQLISVNRSSDTTISSNVLANPNTATIKQLIAVIAQLAGNVTTRTLITGNKFLIPSGSSRAVFINSNNATASVDSTTIVGNSFYGNASSRGIQVQQDSGTVTNTKISDNSINTAQYAIVFLNDSGPTFISGNRCLNVTTRYWVAAGAPTVRQDGNDWQWGMAAPTTQYHFPGERVMHSAPAVGSPTGWVCTVAGTPGTWVALANL